jgi:hypothetical protein
LLRSANLCLANRNDDRDSPSETQEVIIMYSVGQRIKCCWICGKDISLEHSKTDEHGLSVHESCHAKKVLLKAASLQNEAWRKTASPNRAA